MDLTRLLNINPIALAQATNLNGQGDPIIADEAIEARALDHANDFLGKLSTLCDAHGLPRTVDSFRLLIDLHVGFAHAELVKRKLDEQKARRSVTLLTLESAFDILPHTLPQGVRTCLQTKWMDIDQISIEGTPEHWRIHDLQIGNMSQLGRPTSIGIGGEMFGKDGMLSQIRLPRLHQATDLRIWVQYVGPREKGEKFHAIASGMSEGCE